jgi:predicted HD phosphohydrolase
MSEASSERARFRALDEASAADWHLMERAEREYRTRAPGEGLLTLMAAFEHADPLGAPINVYQHCLQTATRALEAGADEELIVLSLFHDLPECFSDAHHGELGAQMLGPWLTEPRRWLLARHVEFQAYHFAQHPSRNRNEREAFRGHPQFAPTALFCERFDQCSFDPAYPTRPLAYFEPLVRRFFDPERMRSSTAASPVSSNR